MKSEIDHYKRIYGALTDKEGQSDRGLEDYSGSFDESAYNGEK